jgi:iron(III) transport system permease protein
MANNIASIPSGYRVAWNRFTQPRVYVPLIGLAILLVLVVGPIATLIFASFRPVGVYPLDPGPFVLDSYRRVLQDPALQRTITDTMVFATGVLVFGLPLAGIMAYLTERTDMPFRNQTYMMLFIPMSTPVFATGLGWILLLGPRAGMLNVWWRELFNSTARDGPVNIFSMGGLIFAGAIGLAPSMWLFLISVLRNMDPTLEEAAAVSGAGRFKTLMRVTLPLMRPGTFAVGIFFFIVAIESLELPLALGLTAGIETISVRILRLVNGEVAGEVDYGLPATLGVFALIIGTFGVTAYLYLVRSASKYAVMTGKGYRPRMLKLGRLKWVAVGFFTLYLVIKVVLPFGVLLYASFLQFYQPFVSSNFQYLQWTLSNYLYILDWRFAGRFFMNTIIVSIAASFGTMFLVSFLGWLVVRMPGTITRTVNVIAFMPLAVPGTISSTALLLLFIGTPVYGTLALLVLAYVFRYIAFGTRLMHAAQIQVSTELEEAALTSGATRMTTFFRINLRLLIPAFINGWLYILVHVSKDFSVPLLLASGSTLLIGNIIFSRWEQGDLSSAAALMVILIAFNLIAVFLGRRWLLKSVGMH